MASFNPACASTSRRSSSTRWLGSARKNRTTSARKLLWLGSQLLQRPRHAARHLATHVPAMRAPVPHRDCRPRTAPCRHAPCPIASRNTAGAAGPRSTRSPTKASILPCGGVTCKILSLPLQLVAQSPQKLQQFIQAAVHIAHNVERPVRIAQVDRIALACNPAPLRRLLLRPRALFLSLPAHSFPV